MKKLIISFKSRNDVFSFSRLLQQNGISSSTINTPAKIGSSCSLSLRCDAQYLPKIKNLLYQAKPNSFKGLFLLSINQQSEQIVRLI